MSKRVQHIRYTTAQMAIITGKNGEIMVNLSTRACVVHDGATPGGFEQARADLSNAVDASESAAGRMTAAYVVSLNATVSGLADVVADVATNTADIDTNTSDIATEVAARISADSALDTAKADKVVPAAVDNVATLDAAGNLQDGGQTIAQIIAAASTGELFPAGTKVVFAQASAPTGWTQDSTNDRALRVVSSAGGGSGGTHSLTSPPSTAHTHQWYNNRGMSTTAQTYNSGGSAVSISHATTVNGAHILSDNVASLQGLFIDGYTTNTGPTAFEPKYSDVIFASWDG